MPRTHRPMLAAGTQNPLPRYAQQFVQRRAARALAQRFRARLQGAENVPREGGAVLVCHRSRWDLDAVPLAALVWLETGREIHLLDGRSMPRAAPAMRALAEVGLVPTVPEDPLAALRGGALLCVFPQGDDMLRRPHGEVSALRWGARSGFARLALLAGVPVVPIVALGADELLDRARSAPGSAPRASAGSPRWESPAQRALRPRRMPIEYCVLPALHGEGDGHDPAPIEWLRRHAHDAIQGAVARARSPRRGSTQLDDLRARRRGGA